MKQFTTHSENETKSFAEKLARKTKTGVIALFGELGAGKTVFAQGFAEGLGIKEKIISPTFVLIRQHPISGTKKVLYHIDLYRLNDMKDLKHLGLEEIWSDPKNIVLIEWADKIKNLLPKEVIEIYLDVVDTNTRKITLNSPL